MRGRLHRSVAFVTGGSSGIGRAAALALGAEGARVAVTGRNRQRLEATVAAIRDRGGDALSLVADVRSEADVDRAVAATVSHYGGMDIHIACAGRGGSPGGRLPSAVVQMTGKEWDDVIDTNLKGVFLSNRAVLQTMTGQGSGIIINVTSSPGAIRGSAYAAAYCASKHALMGLTHALAEEMRGYGVRVMTLLPDATDTPLIAEAAALAPHGKMPPSVVAGLMIEMILQPDDTLWLDPLIAPYASGTEAAAAPSLRKRA